MFRNLDLGELRSGPAAARPLEAQWQCGAGGANRKRPGKGLPHCLVPVQPSQQATYVTPFLQHPKASWQLRVFLEWTINI